MSAGVSSGKIVFQKSHFKHPKSQHLKTIKEHWFNAGVDITIPDSTSLPALGLIDNIQHSVDSERYCSLVQLPVSSLIREDFIEAFVKKGDVYLMSQKTRIDCDDCICILPTGHLILNVTKDTYEHLGLEGKHCQHDGKRTRKFVITMDLAAEYFKPGRKGYDRIKSRLDDWGAKFDILLQWKPNDPDICPSSLPVFLSQLSDPGVRIEKQSHKHKEIKMPQSLVPIVSPNDHAGDQDSHVCWEEFYDWLGCKSCGISEEGTPGSYVNTYATPEPNREVSCLSVHRYAGFLSPSVILSLLENLRENLQSSGLPWLALTVHGYPDSPVSWQQKQHSFLKHGDNFYTFILFPDENYWLIECVGAFDVCP